MPVGVSGRAIWREGFEQGRIDIAFLTVGERDEGPIAVVSDEVAGLAGTDAAKDRPVGGLAKVDAFGLNGNNPGANPLPGVRERRDKRDKQTNPAESSHFAIKMMVLRGVLVHG